MKKRGFTLVELLIVIAIIGILAAITLASYGSSQVTARDTKRITNVGQLQLALEGAFANSPRLSPSYPDPTVWQTTLMSQGLIKSVYTDPVSGHQYDYMRGPNSQSYCIGANLENGGNAAIKQNSTCSNGFSWCTLGTTGTSGTSTGDNFVTCKQ